MKDVRKFYINGEWVEPSIANDFPVENPATEQDVATISLGNAEDVNKAVVAARAAFGGYSQTSIEERLELLKRLSEIYVERSEEMAEAISMEMGAPITFAREMQAPRGIGHIKAAIRVLANYTFGYDVRNARVVREPIGVCGLITPWNWPMNQIACKVAPALAVGCTVVLKPSEIAPLSGMLFAEMIDQAGFPKGVFNLVNGNGPDVGAVMAAHPDIDMMSFTGSTRAGIAVSQAAAQTVKHVALELGGKSPNLILDDADIGQAVKAGVFSCFGNVGQSCNAPTRMLVPADKMDEAIEVAAAAAAKVKVGHSSAEGRHIGPLSNKMQFDKVQQMIVAGIEEGATLVSGGLGKPQGFDRGYYVKPTVFANVNNQMTIARQEIFGPVLSIIPYGSEEEAIEIANDTPYGLAAYIQTADMDRARRVARKLRVGMVSINGAHQGFDAPFGGYKQSGIGREWGAEGFADYLETKSINGFSG